MREVADFLKQHATRLARDGGAFDIFARSAVNRYYYAVFLIARELYLQIYPGAQMAPAHGDFPNIYLNNIYKKISEEINAAVKSQDLAKGDGERLKHLARAQTAALHDLLRTGYEMRKIADYRPEIMVLKERGSFTLYGVTLEAAANWVDRAELCYGGIRKVWIKLGH